MTNDASSYVVQACGVCKSFLCGTDTVPVLNGIDLKVAAGEIVMLAGPSGSGKTTLLSIIGGLLQADTGQVLLDGTSLAGRSSRDLTAIRRNKLGFMFQQSRLLSGLSALENVALPLLLSKKLPSNKAQRRAGDLLRAVDMGDKLHVDPRQLSVGQCQRIALARALATFPTILLADEPTASLDSKNGIAAMKLLRALTKRFGLTAIVVTHDSRIVRYADRVVAMSDGRIVADKSVCALLTTNTRLLVGTNTEPK